jgi:hypothetical protein
LDHGKVKTVIIAYHLSIGCKLVPHRDGDRIVALHHVKVGKDESGRVDDGSGAGFDSNNCGLGF